MKLISRLRTWNRARRFRSEREKPECDFATACIQPGHTAIDIGAHKAAFTYWMWKAVGATGQVLAFEPQRSLAGICQKFADSCDSKNVTVAQVALSDKEGQGFLKVTLDDLSCGSLEDHGGGDHEVLTEQVPITTLDSFVDESRTRRPVSFIKCDVEGHELAALKGGLGILQHDQPVVMLESFDRLNPAFELLIGEGYIGYCFAGDRLQLLEETKHDTTIRHNFVFLHPSRTKIVDCSPPYSVEWLG